MAAQEAIPSPQESTNYSQISHIEPGGIGYTQGYTSVDFFFSEVFYKEWIPFLDTRAHVFNTGNPAFNLGAGVRFVASEFILGSNLYYDYRKTSLSSYNQVCMGFEALGDQRDVRLNVYLPFGAKTFENPQYKEFAMPGANIEVGKRFDVETFLTCYGAIGAYYFARSGKHAMGGNLRGSFTFFKYLKIEGFASYDPVFKGIGQGELSVLFPFGLKRSIRQSANKTIKAQERFIQRAFQSVNRFEMIVLDRI